MTILILHLSDIHTREDSNPLLENPQNIAACLNSALPRADHVVIVISGDVAFSGRESEYERAFSFLQGIKDSIQKAKAVPIAFVSAPGNHDCDFRDQNQTRAALLRTLKASPQTDIDQSIIDNCLSVQADFIAFQEKLEEGQDLKGDELWRTTRIQIGDHTVAFNALNFSWCSERPESPASLLFPLERYRGSEAPDKDATVRLIVAHHPLHWIQTECYRPLRQFLRETGHAVLTGHEHCARSGQVSDSESGISLFIEGSALQSHSEGDETGFNIIELNVEDQWLESRTYSLDGAAYRHDGKAARHNLTSCTAESTKAAKLSEEFRSKLADPGAPFAHPSFQHLRLGDIFVFPDLKHRSSSDDTESRIKTSAELCQQSNIASGVVLEGEEKVGKTSLLYRLFEEYYRQGKTPVLIKGERLKANSEQIHRELKRAASEQYAASPAAEFDQAPPDEIIILVDNLERMSARSSLARAKALSALLSHCGGLVCTADPMIELRDVLQGGSHPDLDDVAHYRVLPLGYERRGELITRWYSGGLGLNLSDADLLAKCDQAERIIDAMMAKAITPSLPLYLLTILQGIEAGATSNLRESELGHYYNALLTLSLTEAGVPSQRLTENYAYAEALAFEFHSRGSTELSRSELTAFNRRYSEERHTVELGERLATLVAARILTQRGDHFSFRYPYIYYYLKGKYLSDNLGEGEIRQYVSRCCQHLYVRDHANTVLFLAHHTNDEFLLDEISAAIARVFEDVPPVEFDGDTATIANLVSDAPSIGYSGEDPRTHRQRANRLRDEYADDDDGLADHEEDGEDHEDISLLARITTLFKATDILGQVLKTQYSRIGRNRRVELLTKLFEGPLRALKHFYAFLEAEPDALTGEIQRALAKSKNSADQEQLERVAKRAAALVIQLISFSFVLRPAISANADSLREDIDAAVEEIGTNAAHLIGVATILDSPKPIPKQALQRLIVSLNAEVLAQEVLRLMVIRRLYLFKTEERDMQWLAEKLSIDLKSQHKISYQRARPMHK